MYIVVHGKAEPPHQDGFAEGGDEMTRRMFAVAANAATRGAIARIGVRDAGEDRGEGRVGAGLDAVSKWFG